MNQAPHRSFQFALRDLLWATTVLALFGWLLNYQEVMRLRRQDAVLMKNSPYAAERALSARMQSDLRFNPLLPYMEQRGDFYPEQRALQPWLDGLIPLSH